MRIAINVGTIAAASAGFGMRAGVIRVQSCLARELVDRKDCEVVLAFASGLGFLDALYRSEPWLKGVSLAHYPWQVFGAKWLGLLTQQAFGLYSLGGWRRLLARFLFVTQSFLDAFVFLPISQRDTDAVLQMSPPYPEKNLRRLAGAQFLIIYDIIGLIHPEWFGGKGPANDTILKNLQDPNIRIFADSQHTAKDICSVAPSRVDQIRVIPLGVLTSQEDVSPAIGELPIPNAPFFLAVGTIEIRKNLESVLRAYALAALAYQGKNVPPLLIAGAQGWLTERVENAMKELSPELDVRFLGFVSDNLLSKLYERAICLVYLSRYEGFGLPPLEAMSLGTPVIAADNTCLPEVVGDAGILVDPDDVRSAAEAMVRLGQDSLFREELSAKSRRQAKAFTWKACADAVINEIGEYSGKHPSENRGSIVS